MVDVIHELKSFGTQIDIYDPQADGEEVAHEYGLSLIEKPNKKYHAIVLAVSHSEFMELDLKTISQPNAVVFDVKGVLDKSKITARL